MKKKLLHLQLLPILSGVQRFSLQLLDGLPDDEYEIYVASKPGGELVSEIHKRGWHYIALPTFRRSLSWLDFFTLIHLIWILGRYRFDIVHANSSKPGFLGRLAARICRVPCIIFTAHGTSYQPHQPLLVYRFYQTLERFANHFCDYVVFVNNCDRIAAIQMGLVAEHKAVTIYNAMRDMAELNIDHLAAQDDITIGSTLRFSEQKNVIKLTTALCKSCLSIQNLRFILLGDGEHLDLCKSIIASYRLSDRILLPGWDSDVLPWLKLFDAFILYSRWEAMPYSIIEAMHAGLPVIGSDIPSIAEFVTDEVGWLVALDAEAELIQTLKMIAADPQKILDKGKAAQNWIKQISDYPTMIASYHDLYQGRKACTG
jgi:glycosyltransferase involved in cell wall biosynthesis